MLEQLGNIMKTASEIMLKERPEGISSKEGHANFVTQADKKTQDFLEQHLLELLPGSVLFGEEKENETLGDGPTWVVDPIDGTLNYMHGLMHSAISVALCENRRLRLAAIYNPFRNELFTAKAGEGAFLNGQRISCSDTPFERALCFYGTSPYKAAMVDATFETVAQLMKKTADIRRFGSAALDLAYVACGRADVFFEFALSPWDYAAGKLLVEEAGGVFHLMNLGNEALDFSTTAAVFTSNRACDRQAREIVMEGFEKCRY